MARKTTKGATGHPPLPEGLERAIPPGHRLRPFVERHRDRLAPLAVYGGDFVRRSIEDLVEEGDLTALDVHFNGGIGAVLAHHEGLADGKPPSRATLAASEVFEAIASDMGYRKPLAGLLEVRLDLSGNGPVDRYARALASIANVMVVTMAQAERLSQTGVPDALLQDRMSMHGILLTASRLSVPLPARRMIELLDPGRWNDGAANPLRTMIRHYAGLDVPPGTDAGTRKLCEATSARLKAQGFLDMPGLPEFVPLPIPMSSEEEADPLHGVEEHIELLARIHDVYADMEDRRGKPPCLVEFEIPSFVGHGTCLDLQRRGIVHTLHTVTAELTEHGIDLDLATPVDSVTWHLTERGVGAIKAANGRMAMTAGSKPGR